MKKHVLPLAAYLLLAANTVSAAGLAVVTQGAGALGMSLATTARSEDLSTIFYNPAGLDYVASNEVYLGMTPITPYHSFSGNGSSAETETDTFPIPQVYAARRVHDRVVFGIGVFAPYGLGTDWASTWDGRYTSTKSEMQTVYVNPTVSYRVNDMITVGAGVSYIHSSVTLEKMFDTGLILFGQSEKMLAGSGNPVMIANTAFDSRFSMEGDGSAFGFNLGVLVRPVDRLSLGVSYRGATDIDYDGEAEFTHSSATIPVPDGQGGTVNVPVSHVVSEDMPLNQDGEATVHLPWRVNLGMLYDITDRWDLSAETDITGWSTYDDVTVTFDSGKPVGTLVQNKDWGNALVYRLGTSYDLNEALVLRAGAMYDETPIPDYTLDGQLAGNDRVAGSIGAGYVFGSVRVDAAYMYMKFLDREKDNLVGYSDVNGDGAVTAGDAALLDGLMAAQGRGKYPVGNGDYENSSHFFSLSVSYAF